MRTLRTREGRTGVSLSSAVMAQDPETCLGMRAGKKVVQGGSFEGVRAASALEPEGHRKKA